MGTQHTVVQGEYLAKIAARYGFANWRTIYEHPENVRFRELRPDPDIILPGDVIFIPDKKVKMVQAPTGQKHVYQLKRKPPILRLKLCDAQGVPLDGKRYELKVGNLKYAGTLDGPLEHPIPPEAEEALLRVWQDEQSEQPSLTWHLKLGHLDPLDTVSGVQGRLNNLGFDCGSVDGKPGPRTEAAVKSFQETHGLEVDGIVGPATRAKLKEVYGC